MQRTGGRPDNTDTFGGAKGKFDPFKKKTNGKARYLSDELKSVSRKNDEQRNRGTGERSGRAAPKKGGLGGFFGRK